MIPYDSNKWSWLFQKTGSVFPTAALRTVPSVALVIIFKQLMHAAGMQDDPWVGKIDRDMTIWDAPSVHLSIWSIFTGALSFLIVFRANFAYTRFWEGATLVEQTRGQWFNAVSNLMAFCSAKPEKADEVKDFQALIVRLMSMLFCASLSEVANMSDKSFEVIDPTDFDEESLKFLDEQATKRDVILQWIQRLVVNMMRAEVIDIPPPILSRVFQELSIGVVAIDNARKITCVPFPFPFAQMIFITIGLFGIILPAWVSYCIEPPILGMVYTFICTFLFWGIHYIAVEIECPFGDDPNDLPLASVQRQLNQSLLTLLDERAQKPPSLMRYTESSEEGEPLARKDTETYRLSFVSSYVMLDERTGSQRSGSLGYSSRLQLPTSPSSPTTASTASPHKRPMVTVSEAPTPSPSECKPQSDERGESVPTPTPSDRRSIASASSTEAKRPSDRGFSRNISEPGIQRAGIQRGISDLCRRREGSLYSTAGLDLGPERSRMSVNREARGAVLRAEAHQDLCQTRPSRGDIMDTMDDEPPPYIPSRKRSKDLPESKMGVST